MKVFEKQFTVDFRDVDRYFDLKMESFIEKLNTMSMNHTINLGLEPDFMEKKCFLWVLYQWDAHILRHDVYMEDLTFKTFVEEKKGIYFYRYYIAKDKNDEIVAYALSVWIVIDAEKRKVTRIPKGIIEIYNPDKNSTYTKDQKLVIENTDSRSVKRVSGAEFDLGRHIVVLFSDIDSNGHVNNVNYVKWALQGLENEEDELFLKENKVKRITMVYKKEKLPLGKVEVRSLISGKDVYQEILNDAEEVLTLSKTEFIAR